MNPLLTVFVVAFVVCAALLFVLAKMLPADFLAAQRSARSNHVTAARQIGGLAVVPAVLLALLLAWLLGADGRFLSGLGAGIVVLASVGFLDDRRETSVALRLGAQFAAALIVVACLGADFRLLGGFLPFYLERGLIVLGLMWFINLTNFMDGLDLMVVAGIGVPNAVLALLCGWLIMGSPAAPVAAGVAGALAGFALFNRPPARIFLGDTGSLPLGLATGAVVLLMARQWPAAALLPFLYFLADSTSVLLIRLARRENIATAHSKHAYQIARRSGRSVGSIAGLVAVSSFCSAALAGAVAKLGFGLLGATAFLAALLVTGATIVWLRRRSRARAGRV